MSRNIDLRHSHNSNIKFYSIQPRQYILENTYKKDEQLIFINTKLNFSLLYKAKSKGIELDLDLQRWWVLFEWYTEPVQHLFEQRFQMWGNILGYIEKEYIAVYISFYARRNV